MTENKDLSSAYPFPYGLAFDFYDFCRGCTRAKIVMDQRTLECAHLGGCIRMLEKLTGIEKTDIKKLRHYESVIPEHSLEDANDWVDKIPEMNPS